MLQASVRDARNNKLTKLGRCDRETIELANNSNDSIVGLQGEQVIK